MSASAILVGSSVALTLQLEDGDATKFPQAEIRNPAGTLLTTLDLAHVASGFYTNTNFTMPDEDWIAATYITYDDSGHTTESALHLRGQDVFSSDHGALIAFYKGAIWIDTRGGGAAGSVLGVNGIEDNPVDNETDALLLAVALGVKAFKLTGTLTLATTYDGWTFEKSDENGIIAFNSQSVERCLFIGLQCSGALAAAPVRRNVYTECVILAVTEFAAVCERCRFLLNIAIADNIAFQAHRCSNGTANPAGRPVFDFSAHTGGSASLTISDWSGPIEFSGIAIAGPNINFNGIGDIVIAASCSEGTFDLQGVGNLDDQSTGNAVVNRDGFIPIDEGETVIASGIDPADC